MKKSTKRDFVLKQSADLSAKEVVAKAAEENIKLTEGYVYNIRSSKNSRKKAAPKKVSLPSIVKVAPIALSRRGASGLAEKAVLSLDSRQLKATETLVAAIDALVAERVRAVLASLASSK